MVRYILVLFLFLSMKTFAGVPTPPEGKRWVLNADYSDEFNGTELDRTKWNNSFSGWNGRKPAWFNPQAIKVHNGCLEIESGVLDSPFGDYTMYGGAVTSISSDAHFGYYEVSSKASKIAMSTTFWLSNGKSDLPDTEDCTSDKYSQELDIQECVGGVTGTGWSKDFDKSMHSNTHFRIVKCGESSETFLSRGANTTLGSMVYDKFHTYGCWWRDAKQASFYANDVFFETVDFRTDYSENPFPRPMQVNMVTETYDWQTPPSDADLENTSINTAYYDWVRSYYLVDVDAKVNFEGEMPFEEYLTFVGDPEYSEEQHCVTFKMECKAKENRKIRMSMRNDQGYYVLSDTIVYAGYGIGSNVLRLNQDFTTEGDYFILVQMYDTEGKNIYANKMFIFKDLVMNFPSNTVEKLSFYIDACNQLYVSNSNDNIDYKIYDMSGLLLKSGKYYNGQAIDIQSFVSGQYILSLGQESIHFNKN